MKCKFCGQDANHDLGKYDKTQIGVTQCDYCGAKHKDGKWEKRCSECGKETDKLFDIFVPHNCNECSEKLHKEAEEKKDYCGLCGDLRMDCYC